MLYAGCCKHRDVEHRVESAARYARRRLHVVELVVRAEELHGATTAARCNALQHVATRRLQHVATQHGTVQRSIMRCNELQHVNRAATAAARRSRVATQAEILRVISQRARACWEELMLQERRGRANLRVEGRKRGGAWAAR